MSHTVVIDLRCQPGKGPEFLAALLTRLVDTRAFEGCELVETYVDADDADHIVLFEKWADRSNQVAYMAWRAQTGSLSNSTTMLTAPPTFTHLRNAD